MGYDFWSPKLYYLFACLDKPTQFWLFRLLLANLLSKFPLLYLQGEPFYKPPKTHHSYPKLRMKYKMEHVWEADSKVFDFDLSVWRKLHDKHGTRSLSISLIMQLCCRALVSVCFNLTSWVFWVLWLGFASFPERISSKFNSILSFINQYINIHQKTK